MRKRHSSYVYLMKNQAFARVFVCAYTTALSSVTAKVGRHQIELYLGHVSMYKHHFIYRMYDVLVETELPVCVCMCV